MELTELEEIHKKFMRRIAESLTDTPYILKGGTSLLFGYGLDRFSEDLDFDAVKKLNLESKIRAAQTTDMEIIEIKIPKDTKTVQRYKVVYKTEFGERSLKIETSFRNKEIDTKLYSKQEGINMYNIDVLLTNKIRAAYSGDTPRTAARDLFDIHFILENYSQNVTAEHITALKAFAQDEEELFERYFQAYEDDDLVNNKIDLEELVSGVIDKIEEIS